MRQTSRFPFRERDAQFGEWSLMPYVPVQLSANGMVLSVTALLDTGASVNVMPYRMGEALGFVWEQQTTSLKLSGNLGQFEAKAVAIEALIEPFTPVLLAFAWTKEENAPLLLGQMNFFQEFEVCFFRAQRVFEIASRS